MQPDWKGQRGFKLVELVIVMAIVMLIAAMVAPRVLASVQTVRLRSAANGVAGLLQATRMAAVKSNTYYSAAWSTMSSGGSSYNIMYADVNPANGSYDPGEPLVQLPAGVSFDSSGAHPAFNASALLGTSPQGATVMPTFNARGLPCVVSVSVCNTNSGGAMVAFLYFLRLDGSQGARWAAVSVTPAGRVRVWTWDGSSWE